ncbi:MAG: RIP metalloprotease [Thermoleophilia bacterium]
MLGLNILYFVAILMVLVLLHEAGHMVVAKWCGMRVEKFSIFMGRPLWSFRRGETEYAVGWLPLGGYVKISGMTVGEDIEAEAAHRAYSAKPVWKRVATILAGPAVNIVLALVIFAAIFWIGIPTGLDTGSVRGVAEGSAAARADLRPGDRIVAVNGVATDADIDRVRERLRSGGVGDPVRLVVERDGREVPLTGRLQALTDANGDPARDPDTGRVLTGLGFTFIQDRGPDRRYGFVGGLEQGWHFTWFLLKANGEVFKDVFVSSEARDQVSSIVGVGAVFNEVAEDGLITLLRFIGVISLALGVFNLLPILPLDGGHILFALIEKVKGSALSRVAYERASMVGILLLAFVFVIALQNDIGRITGEGFQINP